jgi:hypothetical protein
MQENSKEFAVMFHSIGLLEDNMGDMKADLMKIKEKHQKAMHDEMVEVYKVAAGEAFRQWLAEDGIDIFESYNPDIQEDENGNPCADTNCPCEDSAECEVLPCPFYDKWLKSVVKCEQINFIAGSCKEKSAWEICNSKHKAASDEVPDGATILSVGLHTPSQPEPAENAPGGGRILRS